MKPVFSALALLLSTSVPAQSGDQVTQEIESADRYSFRVELENGHSSELMRCANLLTESNTNVNMKGHLTQTVDAHAELSVDTRRRLLTIEHNGSDPEERVRVKQLAARAKTCLDLPTTPEIPQSNRTTTSSDSAIVTETNNGTHYAYTQQDSKVDARDLVRAFAKAAGITVNARFTGDWTTSDDDGIEYSMDTRSSYLSIRYNGEDPTVAERAREKVRELRVSLNLATPPDVPE